MTDDSADGSLCKPASAATNIFLQLELSRAPFHLHSGVVLVTKYRETVTTAGKTAKQLDDNRKRLRNYT